MEELAFYVYIIESPSPDDLLAGRNEGDVLTQALKLMGIPVTYSLATTERTFRECLDISSEDSRLLRSSSEHGAPLIHISAHGDREGISLHDGTLVTWRQLRAYLVPLNEWLAKSLLLCLSSCESLSGCEMAMQLGNALPFRVLFGHEGEALWSDAAVAFITFYHRFHKGAELTECEKAMQAASGDPNFKMRTSEEVRRGLLQKAIARALAKRILPTE